MKLTEFNLRSPLNLSPPAVEQETQSPCELPAQNTVAGRNELLPQPPKQRKQKTVQKAQKIDTEIWEQHLPFIRENYESKNFAGLISALHQLKDKNFKPRSVCGL